MAYAAASDVQTRLGRPLTEDETAMTNIRLADAERMILRRIPDLADKITAGDVDEADVIQVESDAAIRILKNPDGYTSETDGTYSYRINWDVASGKLEISDAEWRTLGVKASGMFVYAPRIRTPFDSSYWLPLIDPMYDIPGSH